ncbi:MAG: glycosyltransferase family 4 protein [Moorea sp. SIO4A3]|nr:glycosyltransferase family 4 protein [Moorena sp. SIO4A3]
MNKSLGGEQIIQANKRRKIRVTYVIATNLRFKRFEWICSELSKERFELSFILLNQGQTDLPEYLTAQKIPYISIKYSNKYSLNLFWAIWKISRYCRKNKTDIVHTYGVDGSLVGLSGACLGGVQIRIQSRTHAGPFPWPQRVPWGQVYDHFNNFLSSKITMTSQKVKDIVISYDGVAPSKVIPIHPGFDLEAFAKVSEENLQNIKEKYNIKNVAPVVGVVSRYVAWKGVHYIVPAFGKLLEDYPSALLVLANARGNYRKEIHRQLQSIPTDRYVEIPFENDMFALYKLFDVFVHVPMAPNMEAFGQVYIEALAAGIPSVFTRSGVVDEFIVHNKHAYLVDYENSDQIYEGIKTILENNSLRESLIYNGGQSVRDMFDLKQMIGSLESLYLSEFETTQQDNREEDEEN